MSALENLCTELAAHADPEAAAFLQGFFKTGPGEYAEGDRFMGIRVPVVRRIARQYRGLSRADRLELLRSPLHEERLAALVLMVEAYKRGRVEEREAIFADYLAHTRHINNWDLVDVSAPHIVGAHLPPNDVDVLERLAASDDLWERRIAIIATFHFIRQGDFGPTLFVAEMLVHDRHDLIHKAVGWMLREVGKKDVSVLEAFLEEHAQTMPRTALRYAIEKFDADKRKAYLRGEV